MMVWLGGFVSRDQWSYPRPRNGTRDVPVDTLDVVSRSIIPVSISLSGFFCGGRRVTLTSYCMGRHWSRSDSHEIPRHRIRSVPSGYLDSHPSQKGSRVSPPSVYFLLIWRKNFLTSFTYDSPGLPFMGKVLPSRTSPLPICLFVNPCIHHVLVTGWVLINNPLALHLLDKTRVNIYS